MSSHSYVRPKAELRTLALSDPLIGKAPLLTPAEYAGVVGRSYQTTLRDIAAGKIPGCARYGRQIRIRNPILGQVAE
jgi:hypothetical protein